ncbi:Prefoldin subunit-domain-containing protein [Mycena alexandri]|uniref:Prefoldin subunit-domain-containing protein n=1 Tax=Mycena alexandri TaxID=1745969 RepID=A0AAD6S3Z9_9AGAR|nr:Prefoldin subunit-domain-containing protein [Mycena alexandri]
MSQQPQQVSVDDLNVSQLADVRRQLEEELNHLTNSFAQLKQAQSKFRACIENVAEIKPANKGKTILVPLTNSLYVPGKLSDLDHVIVDVGTGYFVQKTRDQAHKHYAAKVKYIQGNLDTLEETIGKKKENMGYLVNVMQAKLVQQQQQGAVAS